MLCTPKWGFFVQSAWLRLQTSRAWLTKENFAGFWQQQDRDRAQRQLEESPSGTKCELT